MYPENRLMVAQVSVDGPAFRVGIVRPLFQTQADVAGFSSYEASPDGQKFLINAVLENANEAALSVVTNWTSLLRR